MEERSVIPVLIAAGWSLRKQEALVAVRIRQHEQRGAARAILAQVYAGVTKATPARAVLLAQ